MTKSFYTIILFCIFYVLVSSFDIRKESDPAHSWLHTHYDPWEVSLGRLEKLLNQNQSKTEIKKQYRKVQADFRKIQFLLEYISEESVKRYINGAPLPSVESSVPTVNVLEPKGFQVLDELLYEESLDMQEIKKVTEELSAALKNLQPVFVSADLFDADIKRAIYKDIVRIYTLQLTGFDTPGSFSGIQNAVSNFHGMKDFLVLFYGKNTNVKILIPLLNSSASYLALHKDFDTMDRVYFYKNYISAILKVLSNWKTDDQTLISRNPSEKSGINFSSEHLFSTSFFNLDYYTLQPKDLMANPNVIQLGKKLFYDPILSQDNKMSCATCHLPEKAFTDGLTKSITNVEGLSGVRNTPTLINAIYTKGYFYDLREDDPSRQILHVIKDKNEFNSDFIDIIDRLETQEDYKTAFKEVFPSVQISKYAITAAITAYVASLSSYDSPFDQYMRGEIQTIDPKVIRGFNLFTGKAACATCHFMPTFSGLVPATFKESESEVLGVPETWRSDGAMHLDPDQGRIKSGKPRDAAPHLLYSFKTTTVRNITKTAPYMHNGAFATLEDVMIFYNKGGGSGLGFALPHQTLSTEPLHLSEAEISDVISFLKSLDALPSSH
jgi:cytochrome c peroxidase